MWKWCIGAVGKTESEDDIMAIVEEISLWKCMSLIN